MESSQENIGHKRRQYNSIPTQIFQEQPKSYKKYYIGFTALIILGALVVLLLIWFEKIPNPFKSNSEKSKSEKSKSENCVGEWETCSTTCGTGTSKYRIKTQKQGDGTSCSVADGAFKSCKIKDCPVNCVGEWEPCSTLTTCGEGTKIYRVRTIKQGDGTNCQHANNYSRTCKIKDCLTVNPTNGYSMLPFTDTDKNVYEIHIFKESTPYTVNFSKDTICDILLVGGGGGGGQQNAGGGGAGGLVLIQNLKVNGTYNINVGSGGIGGDGPKDIGKNGSAGNNTTFIKSDNSVIITANGGGGGGGGGAHNVKVATNGGSGGGGGWNGAKGLQTQKAVQHTGIVSPTGTVLETKMNQFGEDGGAGGGNGDSYAGGGGGGAGGIGNSDTNDAGQNGGLGIDRVGEFIFTQKFSPSIGDNGWFAGGGGSGGSDTNDGYGNGGQGKFGGGGHGDDGIGLGLRVGGIGKKADAINGTGGGGGSIRLPTIILGGNGGSGIVILRYKNN